MNKFKAGDFIFVNGEESYKGYHLYYEILEETEQCYKMKFIGSSKKGEMGPGPRPHVGKYSKQLVNGSANIAPNSIKVLYSEK